MEKLIPVFCRMSTLPSHRTFWHDTTKLEKTAMSLDTEGLGKTEKGCY